MRSKKVFRTQIFNANSKDTIVQPAEAHLLSHPMNAETETKAYAAIEYAVQANLNSSIISIKEMEDSI